MRNTAPMTFFGLIIIFLFLVAGYAMYGKNTLKKEAVERGYAEWVVDSNGETEWKWKEVQHFVDVNKMIGNRVANGK